MSLETIVELKNVFKRFPVGGGWFTALSDVSLTIHKGEFTGMVGPSGSGKTTLLNLIGSLDTPSDGSVAVLGKNTASLSQRAAASLRNERLGFIFQSFNLLPAYTVFENIELPLLLLKYSGAQRRQAVSDAIEAVGLADKTRQRPDQLSGGECQRVAIARAMVKRPEIVLADEPTANLDAENSHHILQTMERLNTELGTTFIFSTHDEKVIRYLKRKITLEDGRISRDESQGNHPEPEGSK